MSVIRIGKSYCAITGKALDALIARSEKTPKTKRTLVSVNEIRGKSFSHIIEDVHTLILANKSTKDYYRLCYIVPGLNEVQPIGLFDGLVTDGRLSLLEGSPLQIEKVGYEVDMLYDATRVIVKNVTEAYVLRCNFGKSYIVSACWYKGRYGTRQIPGNLMFIKCGSLDDAYILATVDSLALGLPETKCEAGFNEAQQEIEHRDWRGQFADFTIWDTDYDPKIAWGQEEWLIKDEMKTREIDDKRMRREHPEFFDSESFPHSKGVGA
jgi:hypothetical protein